MTHEMIKKVLEIATSVGVSYLTGELLSKVSMENANIVKKVAVGMGALGLSIAASNAATSAVANAYDEIFHLSVENS